MEIGSIFPNLLGFVITKRGRGRLAGTADGLAVEASLAGPARQIRPGINGEGADEDVRP